MVERGEYLLKLEQPRACMKNMGELEQSEARYSNSDPNPLSAPPVRNDGQTADEALNNEILTSFHNAGIYLYECDGVSWFIGRKEINRLMHAINGNRKGRKNPGKAKQNKQVRKLERKVKVLERKSKTSVPYAVKSTYKRDVSGQWRELGGTFRVKVLVVGTDDNGTIFSFRLTPKEMVSYIADQAEKYSIWQAISLSLEYRPSCGTNRFGNVTLAYQPNPNGGVPKSIDDLVLLKNRSFAVHDNGEGSYHRISAPSKTVHALNSHLFIDGADSSLPLNATDGGIFFCGVTSLDNTAAKEIGSLYMNIRIRVAWPRPAIQAQLPKGMAQYETKSITSAGAGQDQQIVIQSTDKIMDTLGGSVDGSGTYTIPNSTLLNTNVSGNVKCTGAGIMDLEVRDTAGNVIASQPYEMHNDSHRIINMNALMGLGVSVATGVALYMKVVSGAFQVSDIGLTMRVAAQVGTSLSALGLLGTYKNYASQFPSVPEHKLIERYMDYSGSRFATPASQLHLSHAVTRNWLQLSEEFREKHSSLKLQSEDYEVISGPEREIEILRQKLEKLSLTERKEQ